MSGICNERQPELTDLLCHRCDKMATDMDGMTAYCGRCDYHFNTPFESEVYAPILLAAVAILLHEAKGMSL